MLRPEVQAEILAIFYAEKKSIRSIAMKYGISRDAVRRVIKRRAVHMEPKIGIKTSILDPFKDEVKRVLVIDPKCPATAIMNRLRDLGFTGGMTVVQAYVKASRAVRYRDREGFLRLEFAPGECAQVDWGEFGDIFGNGIKIHCFAMVLCHSRLLYIEFTRSEKFEDFIRCHENGFRYFDGVPRECWYDNLGSAVTERLGSLVKFNARFMAYMGHHNIRPHACNVAKGNEKGRVEDAIKYIRMNFFAGREFKDFEDLIKQSILWRDNTANKREHRSLKRIVRLVFESIEKPKLMARNPSAYEADEIFSRVVGPDFHFIYETNRYSVPWTLVGITITVRVNPNELKIYYHERIITSHTRRYQKNQVITQDGHRAGLLARKPGGGQDTWQVAGVKALGPRMKDYIDLLKAGHRSLRLELKKILALSTIYGGDAVYRGCEVLLDDAIVGVDALEMVLKREHNPRDTSLNPAPINFVNEKLNRIVPAVDLRRYDALLFEHENKSVSEQVEEDDGTKKPK